MPTPHIPPLPPETLLLLDQDPAAPGRRRSLIDQLAAELAGHPNWYVWFYERTPDGFRCTGAVCPLHASGELEGLPNYNAVDHASLTTIIVPWTLLQQKRGQPT